MYRVGATATIKSYAQIRETLFDNGHCKTCGLYFNEAMRRHCGDSVTVRNESECHGGQQYSVKENGWTWCAEWLDFDVEYEKNHIKRGAV